ncbi:MAG TPA: DUF2231 domain-containing protein [Terriglobales bacterium]|nr:DUF2231 domain-containing protein [Terriglobales bacterium]
MRARAHIKSHPLHPILVTFPIALWTAALVADIAGVILNHGLLWAAGFFAIVGGCLGAAMAAIAGTLDYISVVPPESSAKKRGAIHGLLNSAVLMAFVVIVFKRGDAYTQPTSAQLGFEGLAVGVMMASGWLGGTLVYRNQIGVDHRYANAGKWKERELSGWDKPVCNQAELSEGQAMLAKINDERVVVARCAEGIVAFSDHCTHKGGPLSDGAIVGCAVQCPWHGSQFDLRTGRVIAGPAQEKIKVYAIDVRGSEVFVKPEQFPPARKAA